MLFLKIHGFHGSYILGMHRCRLSEVNAQLLCNLDQAGRYLPNAVPPFVANVRCHFPEITIDLLALLQYKKGWHHGYFKRICQVFHLIDVDKNKGHGCFAGIGRLL